jgi:hypothetical protein
MTPEEFRRYGHEVVDWIAEYWTNLESLPVPPDLRPGEVAALLPDQAPEAGEGSAAIRSSIATAQRFAEWVRADERFDVVAPHPFALVCFRGYAVRPTRLPKNCCVR